MTFPLCEKQTSSKPILSLFNLHISTFLVRVALTLFSEDINPRCRQGGGHIVIVDALLWNKATVLEDGAVVLVVLLC